MSSEQLPVGWTRGRLDSFFVLQRGFDLTKVQARPGHVPVISSSGVAYYHDVEKVLAPGVVTGRKGSVGPVYYLEQSFWPHDTSLWVKDFRGNIPKYVWYFLQSLDLGRFDEASSVPTLNRNNVHRQRIAFPPVCEQTGIIKILSAWDRAIETVEALIANARRQKKALMQQLLPGGTQPPPQRLPGFSGEWEIFSVGDVVKEVMNEIIWDADQAYKLLSVRRRSGGVFHRETLLGSEIRTKNLREAKTDNFLISKMQILHGASALVPVQYDGYNISGSYLALTTRDASKLDIRFFEWLSRTPRFYHQTYLCSYGVHIEKMTFNFRLFVKEKILLPPTSAEQAAIVHVLNDADADIAAYQFQRDALTREKAALMQQLLTGKRRVKVENEEQSEVAA